MKKRKTPQKKELSAIISQATSKIAGLPEKLASWRQARREQVKAGKRTPFYKNIWFYVSCFWLIGAVSVSESNPVIEVTEYEVETLACSHEQIEDDGLPAGEIQMQQECVDGRQLTTYKVGYRGYTEVSREMTGVEPIAQPTAEIVLVGTGVEGEEEEEEDAPATPTVSEQQAPPATTSSSASTTAPTSTPTQEQPATSASPQTQTQTQTQSTSSQPVTQRIDYSNEIQEGYCNDGTPARGNPHAAGRANVCYGHGGWVGNQ